MSSLLSTVLSRGMLSAGSVRKREILVLQTALLQAGYRLLVTGEFDKRTELVVRRLQQQHGMKQTGIVDSTVAALLDCPFDDIIDSAYPNMAAAPIAISKETPEPWLPYDDAASMRAFYSQPWQDQNLLRQIELPWDSDNLPLMFHVKTARQLEAALAEIWKAAGEDKLSPLVEDLLVSKAYIYEPIPGQGYLSPYCFGAAIRFNQGIDGEPAALQQEIIDAFRAEGFTWGGDLTSIPDQWMFQLALD